MKIDFFDKETRIAIAANAKTRTCRYCKHRKRYSLNDWSSKVVQCCELQPSKRSNCGYKTIKVTDPACFNYESEENEQRKRNKH